MKKSVRLAVIIWARENVLAKILVALILIVLVVKRVRIIRIAGLSSVLIRIVIIGNVKPGLIMSDIYLKLGS